MEGRPRSGTKEGVSKFVYHFVNCINPNTQKCIPHKGKLDNVPSLEHICMGAAMLPSFKSVLYILYRSVTSVLNFELGFWEPQVEYNLFMVYFRKVRAKRLLLFLIRW